MPVIVSTHSYRGGTGKSNVTANLATHFARAGKRVAIVDTDLPSPGVHVLFGLDETTIGRTINDFLWNTCKIEEAACDVGQKLVDFSGNPAITTGQLLLLPASMHTRDISRIVREGYDINQLNDGLYDLLDRLALDYLFIDTHPGLNEETLLSIAISDVLILILRPDSQDFQGTAVTVEVARKLEVPNMRLVVNKVPPSLDRAQLTARVQQAYDATVAGTLPLTTDMVELGSSGIFSLRFPNHPFSEGLGVIAASVGAAA
jgi:MinD-like ATPase involved in chromosome partitioning or flagellar assembly